MRKLLSIIMLPATLISLLGQSITAEVWSNDIALDANGDFLAFWNWDHQNITIEVTVRTKGWVGFGFSTNGGMAGADMIMGWVKDNQVQFQDRFAPTIAEPLIDKQQDYELLFGLENDTHTTMRFRRALDTCDDQDLIIKKGTVRMIYAWNDQDPVNETGMPYHGPDNRGTKSVLIFDRNVNSVNLTDDVFYWDAETENITVPAVNTAYLCRHVKYPGSANKRHRVGMEMIIHPENGYVVHHVSLYQCKDDISTELLESKLNDPPYSCIDLESMDSCPTPELVWDLGRQYETLPPDVGVPFGNIGRPTYFVVQTHYNNPSLRDDLFAKATMRIYLTEKLRPYDAGAIFVQVRPDFTSIIPPKQPQFVLASNFPSQFTQLLPTDGINVFGLLFHAHKLAHKMRTRHFRNGVELPLLGEDNNFDTNYQQRIELIPEVKILPGDSIRGECEYDTTERTNLTLGGLNTVDEMCRVTLYHYPASTMSLCRNTQPANGLLQLFQVEELWPDNMHIKLPVELNNMSVTDYLYQFDAAKLTDEDVRNIQDIQLHGNLSFSCWTDDTALGPYVVVQHDITNSPYSPPQRSC